jgi:hypothetical protein
VSLKLIAAAGIVLSVCSPAALSAPRSGHPGLERYVAKIEPKIRTYRSLSLRAGALLREQPVVNVDPFVERLRDISDRFDRLRARWSRVTAPHGLKVRHRGMGRAFALLSRALRIWADAVFTRQVDELAVALDRVKEITRSVAYLQRRWAAALRGALRRAQLSVPAWLRAMARDGP